MLLSYACLQFNATVVMLLWCHICINFWMKLRETNTYSQRKNIRCQNRCTKWGLAQSRDTCSNKMQLSLNIAVARDKGPIYINSYLYCLSLCMTYSTQRFLTFWPYTLKDCLPFFGFLRLKLITCSVTPALT